MKYVLIFFSVILTAWVICSCLTKRNNSDFLSRESTDAMKGAAILCVVLCHFMGTFGGGIVLFTPLGGIGVAVFLVLSAYGLNESWNAGGGGYRCWWRKRIIAVVIPYAVMQIVLYWPFHDFSWKAFTLDIFCLKPLYGNGWYLSYLIFWYVLFYAVRQIFTDSKKRIAAFLMLSVSTFFLFTFFMKSSIRAEQSLSFFAGVLLSEMKEKEWIKKLVNWKAMTVFAVVGGLFLALKQLPAVREAPDIVMNTVQLMIKLPAGFGLMQLVLLLSKNLNVNIFTYIGTFGYELYIVHGYILSKFPITWIGAIGFILASFSGAILYYLLIKRTRPYIRKALRVS